MRDRWSPETFVTSESPSLAEGYIRGAEPWGVHSRESRSCVRKQLSGSVHRPGSQILVGAVGASVWPQSDTEEKEGPFATMADDQKPNTDVKASPGGRCGLYPAVQVISVKPASPGEAGDWYHRREAVRVQHTDMPPVEVPEWETVLSARAPFPALCSSSCTPRPSPSSLGHQTRSKQQEEAEEESLQAEGGSEEGTPAGCDDGWECYTLTESLGQEEAEQSQGEASTCQSQSKWEDCFDPELCQRVLVNWEGDNCSSSDSELSIFSFGPSPLPQEDDWDNVSVPELREASQSPKASMAPQAPRQQPAAPSKGLGRLRRALRALFCWPCLRPQTQE